MSLCGFSLGHQSCTGRQLPLLCWMEGKCIAVSEEAVYRGISSKLGFHGGSYGKESACNAGDPCSIPGLGRSPGEGNGLPLQYSCLENSRDRGAWQATVLGIAKSWHDWSDLTHIHYPSWDQAHLSPSTLIQVYGHDEDGELSESAQKSGLYPQRSQFFTTCLH